MGARAAGRVPRLPAALSLMIKIEKRHQDYKGDLPALRDASADIGKGEFVFSWARRAPARARCCD